MELATIKIKVASDATAWWAVVDDFDLKFVDGEAELQVDGAGEHLFYFWLRGSPGQTIAVSIKQGSDQILKLADAIPAGYFQAGNARFFKTI